MNRENEIEPIRGDARMNPIRTADIYEKLVITSLLVNQHDVKVFSTFYSMSKPLSFIVGGYCALTEDKSM